MEGMRKTALVAGIFYLITFVSLPAVVLLHPVLYQTNFILGSGSDTRVLFLVASCISSPPWPA